MDVCQQYMWVYWFVYVVVGVYFQVEYFVYVVGVCGEYQDWIVELWMYLVVDGQVVFVWQYQVEYYQVWVFGEDMCCCQCVVGFDVDFQVVVFQVFLGQFGQVLIVFDDQDVLGFLFYIVFLYCGFGVVVWFFQSGLYCS